MSEKHDQQYRNNALQFRQNASELHEQGRTFKWMGWTLGGVALGVAALGTFTHTTEDASHSPGIRVSIVGDALAFAGSAALVEAGRRSQRRADTYEAALLQAGEYKTLADRIEESVQLVEVAIDDALMQQGGPILPPHSESQAYL
jgi:hypothetical protein